MSSVAVFAVLLAAGQAEAPQPVGPPTSPPAAEAPPPANAGQVSGPDTDAPVAAPAETGTLVFPPSFFAEARPNTASEMVARVPGFSISQNGGVRGFSGAAGNVLIDGARPASRDEGLGDILNRIPATQVERIELIRGGAPGIDMLGFSQVVNVIRRRESQRQHVVTAGGILFDDGRGIPNLRYELNGRDGERIYEFSVGTVSSLNDGVGSGRVVRVTPAGEILRNTRLESESDGGGLSGRARLQQPLLGGVGEIAVNLSRGDFKEEANETSASFNQQFVNRFDNTQGELSARFERPLSPRLTMELRGIQRLTERVGAQIVDNSFGDQTFAYDNFSGESILRGALRFAQSPRFSWEFGAEGVYNFLDAAQTLTVNGAAVPLPQDSTVVEELRGEAFATLAWRITPQLTLDSAMRVEVSRISQGELEREFVYPKPRLLLTWTPNPTNQVRLRLERQVSQLNFGDFAASASLGDGRTVAGNTDLRPQQTTTLEAVYERRFWGDGVLSVTGSVSRFTDAIDVVPVIGADGSIFGSPGNIGDGEGSFLAIEATIPTARLGVSGGRLRVRGSWAQSEVTDPTTGEQRRSSFQTPFVPTIAFTQDIQSWRINWGFDYRGVVGDTAFRIDEISRVRVEDFFTIFAEYKPRPSLSLRAQAYFLERFDRRRTVFDGPRDDGDIRFVEDRNLQPESRIQFRVRQTF